MKEKRAWRVLFFHMAVVFTVIFSIPITAWSAEGSERSIVVFSTNDFHGALLETKRQPGMAKIAGYLEAQREKYPDAVVLLSAGDMMQGTMESNLTFGKPVIAAMNLLGFDAMALGNHEFDWGVQVLRERGSQAQFPFLSANLQDQNGLLQHVVRSSLLVVRQGVKIGIVGLTTPETKEKTNYKVMQSFDFEDAAQAAAREITALRNRGAQVVIVVAHMGCYMMEGKPEGEIAALAERLHGVDLIISGHTHQLINTAVNGIPIVQAGCSGIALTKAEITYDSDAGQVTKVTPSLVDEAELAAASVDLAVAGIVQEAEQSVQSLKNKVVGRSRTDLSHERYGDSVFGQYLTDRMRARVGAEIAFFNGGGIRSSIPAGKITAGQIYEALPFDNVLCVLQLSGAQIYELIETSMNQADHSRLQFSGIVVQADVNGGWVTVTNVTTADGAPLDRARLYRAVTNDFLADGGDGLAMLRRVKSENMGLSIRDLLIKDLTASGTIAPVLEPRLRLSSELRQKIKEAA